jgi:alkanesulfonate monooxygenase SsuD/methylene tetrahydromethanopterin reductase-like flavin-dependent oxidoreductase (luciferase family)
VSVRSGSLMGLKPDLKAYRDAFHEAGNPGRPEVYLRLSMHVGDNDAIARKEGEPSIMAGYKSLIDRLEGSPNARRRAEVEEVKRATYDDVIRDKVIVGSPDTVADRLKELEAELGIDGILFELNFGAAIPAEVMMRSLQLICEEVMPHFK